jgi:FKBP-type peptidyl-prolyl cis-trans isomerase 2
MNSPLRLLLGILLAVGILCSPTFAFSPDNALLSKLYDKVDMMYETAPSRVLHAYHKLPIVKIAIKNNTELAYYLDKLEAYIHGKLFTFTEQPNFVCLDSYVQKNDTIEVDYTITQPDGVLITTTLESVAREMGIPVAQIEHRLAFNAWTNQVMPGMDKLVLGAKLHENKTALLEPRDAYGSYNDDKRLTYIGNLPEEIQISEVGERVMMKVDVDGEEYVLIGIVVEKNDSSALVDFNHPRAWETIILSLEVMNLFKACAK